MGEWHGDNARWMLGAPPGFVCGESGADLLKGIQEAGKGGVLYATFPRS